MQQTPHMDVLDAQTYEVNKFARLAQESQEARDEAIANGDNEKARVHESNVRYYKRKVERLLQD